MRVQVDGVAGARMILALQLLKGFAVSVRHRTTARREAHARWHDAWAETRAQLPLDVAQPSNSLTEEAQPCFRLTN